MIDAATIEKIRQIKTNCLATKHLHVRWFTTLDKLDRFVDCLAVSVPIAGFVFRLLTKGTIYSTIAEVIWEILAGLLLILVIVKIAYGWQGRAEKHRELLGDNISLVGRADSLLSNIQNISSESIELFFVLAEKSEISDRQALGEPKQKERHFYYRKALEEMNGVCRECGASPWHFKPGSCQACGNTPTKKED